MNTLPGSFLWLLKMAWRDSRRSWRRLLLFSLAITVGIAALVAIQSFSESLQSDLQRQSRSLLAADLRIDHSQPMPDSMRVLFDSLGGERSSVINFVSMGFFPKSQNTKLVAVQGIENNYPLYGEIKTQPAQALATFHKGGPVALVDQTIMLQFGVAPGDSLRLGQTSFVIAGQIDALPGRAGIASAIAPLVLVQFDQLEGTGLLQKGSRVGYSWLLRWKDGESKEALIEQQKPRWENAGMDIETASDRQRGISRAFKNLGAFLQLVGFVALLLGCIGVASGVQVYVKEKQSTVAILRCLGASGNQTFALYVLQVGIISAISAFIGVVLGSLLLPALPLVLADFLPLQQLDTSPSATAILQGWLTGTAMALVFALLPLLSLREVSPLSILRADVSQEKKRRDPLRWLLIGVLLLLVVGLAWWQTGAMEAVVFALASLLALGLLTTVARLLMWAVRKFFPVNWAYPMRQGLANLYRPNNQTVTLLVTIGLGTALLATLYFTRDILLSQVSIAGQGNRPNMILFDIQTPQKEAVAELVKQQGMPLMQQVPIVSMRLERIDGKDKAAALKDTVNGVRRWIFDREYRITYRDTLIETEKVIEGQWHGEKAKDGVNYISLATNMAEDMHAKVGTKLVFNVQGVPVETVVSSIREVDFTRVQTNFMVVFPSGLLEKAPQFHVVVSRTQSSAQSAAFQRALIKDFPNVSVVDLTQILQSVDEILKKLTFVVRFMALFSILTGLLVLVSALAMSRYHRIRESVLLRTLGAGRRQIMLINLVEYTILGALAALTGLILAVAGAWALAYFQLETPFSVRWQPALILWGAVVLATVVIGLWTSRRAVNYPPLEVLRQEA